MATRIPVALERVTLPKTQDEPHPYGFGRYGWRSVYKMLVAGELVGFLTMATGWGKKWEIYGLEAPITLGVSRGTHALSVSHTERVAKHKNYERDDAGNRRTLGEPLWPGSSMLVREPGKFVGDCKYFASKERALDEVPDMLEDGYLRPESVVLAEAGVAWEAKKEAARQHAVEREKFDTQQAARAAQKDAELDHVAAGFVEMLIERKVSNYQLEALMLAAKHLGIAHLLDGL